MRKIIDQKYLRDEQYKIPDKLGARINLHRRFSTNPYGWQRWVFDQLELEPGMRVLEVGCGPGDLWIDNLERLPANLHMFLGDLSLGMVRTTEQGVKRYNGIEFLVLDTQAIPMKAGLFDLVIANHMLYHVPDLGRGISEVVRQLKPGGRLCASTIGLDHMRELREFIERFRLGYQDQGRAERRFVLENAANVLGGAFKKVELRRYEDDLVVTEVEPFLDYLLSMWDAFETSDRVTLLRLEDYLQRKIHLDGQIRITKSQGIIIGS